MNENLLVIESAVKLISCKHKEFSTKYFDSNAINLKSTLVTDIFENEGTVLNQLHLEYIFNYVIEMNSIILDLNEFIFQYHSFNPRFRIKQRESIEGKLYHYLTLEHEGKTPLNKCLNDLLGFRLLLNNLNEHTVEVDLLLKKIGQELGFRYYLRSDGDYFGIHIHFKNGNNKFFPWELQLWDSLDYADNIQSHEDHKAKREYTNWPKIYKLGKTERE